MDTVQKHLYIHPNLHIEEYPESQGLFTSIHRTLQFQRSSGVGVPDCSFSRSVAHSSILFIQVKDRYGGLRSKSFQAKPLEQCLALEHCTSESFQMP